MILIVRVITGKDLMREYVMTKGLFITRKPDTVLLWRWNQSRHPALSFQDKLSRWCLWSNERCFVCSVIKGIIISSEHGLEHICVFIVPEMIISFVQQRGKSAVVHTKQSQVWGLPLSAAHIKLFSKTKQLCNISPDKAQVPFLLLVLWYK